MSPSNLFFSRINWTTPDRSNSNRWLHLRGSRYGMTVARDPMHFGSQRSCSTCQAAEEHAAAHGSACTHISQTHHHCTLRRCEGEARLINDDRKPQARSRGLRSNKQWKAGPAAAMLVPVWKAPPARMRIHPPAPTPHFLTARPLIWQRTTLEQAAHNPRTSSALP